MSFVEMRCVQIERRRLAGEIKDRLVTFEHDLGRALASGTLLVGYLPAARSAANVSAVVGQGAIEEFVSSIRFITDAMKASVAGHHRLEETRRSLRISPLAGGDKDTIPSVRGVSFNTRTLGAVPG
jgi:hypothetical protein